MNSEIEALLSAWQSQREGWVMCDMYDCSGTVKHWSCCLQTRSKHTHVHIASSAKSSLKAQRDTASSHFKEGTLWCKNFPCPGSANICLNKTQKSDYSWLWGLYSIKNKGLGACYNFEYFTNIKSFTMSKLLNLPARRLEVVRKVRFLALLSPCAPQHTWKSPRVSKGGQNFSLTINSQSFCYSPSGPRFSTPFTWFHHIHWFYTYTLHLELYICIYYAQMTLPEMSPHLNFFAGRGVQYKELRSHQ